MQLFNTGALGIIDITKPIPEPNYYICDKDRKRLSKLSNAVKKTAAIKLGNNNELDLQVPCCINGEIDPNLELLKSGSLIELFYNGESNYFIISQEKNIYDESEQVDYKQLTCFSLVYELTYNSIPQEYSVSAYSLKEILLGKPFETDGLLKNTEWGIGYVSASILEKYRSVSLSDGTIFEGITQVAEVFNAIINLDEKNKKINFYDEEDPKINLDKGLVLTETKYLSGLEQDIFDDEIKTRMYVEGKDGLTLSLVTSDGSSCLTDYSYYMQGFKMDAYGNVISSSYFGMSDALCKAITNYNKLLSENSGQLSNLLEQKINLLKLIDMKNAELSDLETELSDLKNQLTALQTNNLATSDMISKKNTKQLQFDSKQAEIDQLEMQLQDNIRSVKAMQSELSETNNFTPSLLREKQYFTRTVTYKNENYDVDTELYEAALDEFKQYKKPRTTITMDVVNFLSCLDTQYDWDKLEIGDIVTVKHGSLGIEVKARITEIDYDFDDYTISVTISNIKEVINNVQKFIDTLYQGVSSGSTIDSVEKRVRDLNDDVATFKEIISGDFEADKRNITAGNGTVEINSSGVTTFESGNPSRMLRLSNGTLMLSTVGEDGLRPIINADGFITDTQGLSAAASESTFSFGEFDIKASLNEIIGSKSSGFEILGLGQIKLLSEGDGGRLEINGMINTLNASKVQVNSYYDENGGYIKLYDKDGQDTIMMTCNQENNTPQDGDDYVYNANGGKIILYNNKKLSEAPDSLSMHQRLELGSKEYISTTDSTKNNDFGYIYVKNSEANNVVKIQGSNSGEKCGIIALNNEKEEPKLIIRSYNQTDNLGVQNTSMNNGGNIELRSYDGKVQYFIKINDSNCLILHDTKGTAIEINPTIDCINAYHYSGSHVQIGKDINIKSSGVINLN